MKKVITDRDTTVVATADASDKKFYAVCNERGIYVGIVQRQNNAFLLNPLSCMMSNEISGDAGFVEPREDLGNLLDKIIITLKHEVHEFPTAKSMFVAIGKSLQ